MARKIGKAITWPDGTTQDSALDPLPVWLPITLGTNADPWGAFGDLPTEANSCLDDQGIVHLNGTLQANPGDFNAGDVIATIDPSHAPSRRKVYHPGNNTLLYINTDGTIKDSSFIAAGNLVCLDGITYPLVDPEDVP